jgi:hypothetical protein
MSQKRPLKGSAPGAGRSGRIVLALFAVLALAAIVPVAAGAAGPKTVGPEEEPAAQGKAMPVTAKVLSPEAGESSGAASALFTIDVSLEASKKKFNGLLSPKLSYVPFFNSPTAPTFHPGPDVGAPGLVVLLSTTPSTPGTPFGGPATNLAGLFQVNGAGKTEAGLRVTRNTWQASKPLWGTGTTTLTVFAVEGTAPTIVTPGSYTRISNVVKVPFEIAG